MSKTIPMGKPPVVPQTEPKEAIEKFVQAPAREVNPSSETKPVPALGIPELPFVESKQRFPLELPLSMHTFLMVYCKQRRKNLRDELMPLIEEHARKLGYVPPTQ